MDAARALCYSLSKCTETGNHYRSTDQCKKSYQGADGCAERTTRSSGLPALIVLYYDHRDALLMERTSHSPLPVELSTVFLSL